MSTLLMGVGCFSLVSARNNIPPGLGLGICPSAEFAQCGSRFRPRYVPLHPHREPHLLLSTFLSQNTAELFRLSLICVLPSPCRRHHRKPRNNRRTYFTRAVSIPRARMTTISSQSTIHSGRLKHQRARGITGRYERYGTLAFGIVVVEM